MLPAHLSTIRVALAIVGTFAAPAFACSCMFPLSSATFLHLAKDGRITLPANALGVLFQKELQLDAGHDNGNGVAILNTLPPKLNPAYFSLRDDTAMQPVTPVVTPVDIDAQLGRRQSYYLASAGKIAEQDIAELGGNLHRLARKYGLRDVSAQVKSAVGLFRVAPAGGFIEGHTYSIYPNKIEAGGQQHAIIRIGPRLSAGSPGKIMLTHVGPPKAQLLAVAAAPCAAPGRP